MPPLQGTELNRLADDIVKADGQVFIHSAAPGANGTANRIGGNNGGQAADDANWSDAADGDVAYNADLNYGVLSSAAAVTVQYWSYVVGNVVKATGEVHDTSDNPTIGVEVPAGDAFKLNSGTVRINGSTT